MTNIMTYETIDWKLEAKRVARAFDLREACEFHEMDWNRGERNEGWRFGKPEHRTRDGNDDFAVPHLIGAAFHSNYFKNFGRVFHVFTLSHFKAGGRGLGTLMSGLDHAAAIYIGWDGAVSCNGRNHQYAATLAKGLFRLGYLTPEVEAAMPITISAHQKLEWTLEYEARNGL